MMDDLISRQMAIDAVRGLYIQTPKINNDIVYDTAIDQAHDALINLPSAQPETNCSEIPNGSDTISRQAAIDALWSLDAELRPSAIDAILNMLNGLPSAQPEYEPVTAEDFAKTMSENTLYSFMTWHGEALELMERQGFVICKKTM